MKGIYSNWALWSEIKLGDGVFEIIATGEIMDEHDACASIIRTRSPGSSE
jgi:hypothetical protein